ncbi:MAG: hypothetical protein ABJF23_31880 [Bryobacteraceae bacterium]
MAVLIMLATTGAKGNSSPPITINQSLEWATRTSELIVIGRPISVRPDVVRKDDFRFEEDVTINVERVLAGEFNKTSLTFRWKPDRRVYMKYWLEQEREQPNVNFNFHMFFFLNRAPREFGQDDRNSIRWTRRADLLENGSWTNAAGRKAETTAAILSAVEAELAYMRANGISWLNLEAEDFSRTITLATGPLSISPKGSVMLKVREREYVIVPAYPRLQQQALDLCRSSDVADRARGAFMLRSYPGEVSTQMLTALLKDHEAYRWNMSNSTSCATYMVRAAAYDVLRNQGVSVPKPLLDECHNQ